MITTTTTTGVSARLAQLERSLAANQKVPGSVPYYKLQN